MVCVDSGYELHVGGNGGIKVRATDLLCKVATEEEALDVLRRLHPALPRGGALSRAHRAVDRARRARLCQGADRSTTEAGRDALAARFRYSQQFMQDDPWAERAAGRRRATFTSQLAEVRPIKAMEGANA